MKKITINGKEYNAVDFDLNTICDLDDMGLSIEDFGKKQMSLVRGYVALCIGCDVKDAGNEIQAHIVNGGDLDAVVNMIAEKVDESDFFRSLGKTEKQNVATSKSQKK